MTSVLDVAEAVLLETGETDAWTLQKLTYYCQAWSVVHSGAPIFSEEIQAWTNGPVVPRLWRAHRGSRRVSSIDRGDASLLSTKQRELVRDVVKRYRHLSPSALVALTHRENPWREARGNLPDGAASNAVIGVDRLREFYGRFAPDEARGLADALGSLGLEEMMLCAEEAAIVREVAAGRLSGDEAARRVLAGQ